MTPLAHFDINSGAFLKSITTQRYGTHYFCFLNNADYSTKVSMQIAIGKRAKDYGSTV